MIKVLVVDDSPAVREFLTHILNADPRLQVIGTARNGEEAIEATMRLTPDVITMDIHMPGMDGFEATRRIMETRATPTVIVSGSSTAKEVAFSFRALEMGALAVVPRPMGIGDAQHESAARELTETVRLMSEVKMVRRLPRRTKEAIPAVPLSVETGLKPAEVKIAAVGCSTGGPIVLQTILSKLPEKFPIPVLIVQHIAPGFVNGFAEWLNTSSHMIVHVASHGAHHLPGHAYVAPDGLHMGVDTDGRIVLSDDNAESNLRPSVSYLFRSVTKVYGGNTIGVLLTGMGSDGARELKMMRERGAVTIAQDRASSVVFGMPGEAVNLDAATYVLPPEEIAKTLERLVVR